MNIKDKLYLDWGDAVDDFDGADHEENYHLYQAYQLDHMTDEEIIVGMIKAYQETNCPVSHWEEDFNTFKDDECRVFRYSNGFDDHFIIRWFESWARERNRTALIDLPSRLKKAAAFW